MAASDSLLSDSGQIALSHSLAMINSLVDICENNCKHFVCDETEAGQRFLCAFLNIIDHAAVARKVLIEIFGYMHEYDFDESVPGNGYRSMVKVLQACINHTVKTSKYVAENRGHLLFRKTTYMK